MDPNARNWEHRYEGTTVWFGLSTDAERAEMESALTAHDSRITIEWREVPNPVPADNADSVKLDDEDRGWLASETHRAAYTKSPEDRTPEEQEMAEDIIGAIVRSGGDDGDFPWLDAAE